MSNEILENNFENTFFKLLESGVIEKYFYIIKKKKK